MIKTGVFLITAYQMPRWITIILKDDLCDTCQPGNDVSIVGTVIRRWGKSSRGSKIEAEIVIVANSVKVS